MDSAIFTNTHLHITTWVIGIILFFVAVSLIKGGNEKGSKIVQMILRLFYLLILFSGIMLFIKFHEINDMLYGMKMLFGIIVIGLMEMVLARAKKGKSTGMFFTIFVIVFLIVLYLGFKLPIGLGFFA
ncbi:putative membrane protein SirB2 [Oikeobacillus pervagus]|uniref:UPF0344 protein J2S13_001190 n=1 Tax=Oikeobacillus pervagus TaxID=1325931 RepID=A0AAJ1SXT7_9BACI|nr:YisL family protein [Oikeobacillus pervagus]MDQ0214793.1 putative membrane protein SirB2 [Oikeobacillus pervagus]